MNTTTLRTLTAVDDAHEIACTITQTIPHPGAHSGWCNKSITSFDGDVLSVDEMVLPAPLCQRNVDQALKYYIENNIIC